MGYRVFRVKNEQIQNNPEYAAEEIFQTYLEVSGTEEKVAKITKLKKPENYQSVPIEIESMLPFWAKEFNKNLGEENWSTTTRMISFLRELGANNQIWITSHSFETINFRPNEVFNIEDYLRN